MSDQIRHIVVIAIGAAVACVGAWKGVCTQELLMVATAIITGEFGLARSGSPSDRKVTIQHTTGPADTTTVQGPPT